MFCHARQSGIIIVYYYKEIILWMYYNVLVTYINALLKAKPELNRSYIHNRRIYEHVACFERMIEIQTRAKLFDRCFWAPKKTFLFRHRFCCRFLNRINVISFYYKINPHIISSIIIAWKDIWQTSSSSLYGIVCPDREWVKMVCLLYRITYSSSLNFMNLTFFNVM